MTFIYMWCCCIFISLHCEDYSKDYEDDDSNSMIFLSFGGANRGGEANVNSLVNEGDIDHWRKRPGQKEAIAALSGRG